MIIDVSEHNGTLDWDALKPKIEGAIIRCGYGSDIQKQDDKQWTRNVAECERLGIPYGVYLYSYAQTEESARSEASHVLRCLKGHKPTLPVFWDIEENSLQHTARKFFYVFADAIGSAYRVGLYTGEYYYNACCYGIAAKYRWIAKYGTNDGQPHTAPVLQDGKPYQLWQYTSKALSGHMDASQVIDREMLFRSAAAAPQKTVDQLAQEVIAGQWGAGDDRKNRLTAAGYDYAAVQAKVNEILTPTKKSIDEIAKEVIAGQWGSGADRKAKLQAAGYDYDMVQAKVNALLGATAKPKKSIDQIAREVIAGKWGNDPKRSAALKKAGYDPAKVQARVNQLL